MKIWVLIFGQNSGVQLENSVKVCKAFEIF
jgi:hypothetical protein